MIEPSLDRHIVKAGLTETQCFETFNILEPKFDIKDIASSLSKICRWGGHCSEFYSVAEHSLMVHDLMEGFGLGDPLEGLLHDATEAYLSDVISPHKPLMPDWKVLDSGLETKVRQHFYLPERKTPGCTKADGLALYIEAYHLLPSKGFGPAWPKEEPLRNEALTLIERGWVPRFRTNNEVEKDFLTNFDGETKLRRSQRAV